MARRRWRREIPRKEMSLLVRDLGFYLTGKADLCAADWQRDPKLYPIDCGYQLERADDYFAPYDPEGIPMRDLPGGLGLEYLPSRIAAYGFANWNRLRAFPDEDRYRDSFMKSANWFACQPSGRFEHHFPLVGLSPPWLSCIAQGEGISVLTRAYRETGLDLYASQACSAAEPFFVSAEQGGLLDHLPDGRPFLEEYPCTIYSHVLNGCLYAIVGMCDLVDAQLDRNDRVFNLCNDVIAAIEVNIGRWQIRNWTTYDFADAEVSRTLNLSTMTYQTVHWILLDYIGQRRGRPLLVAAAQRWKNATESLSARLRALAGKVAFRMDHGYRR